MVYKAVSVNKGLISNEEQLVMQVMRSDDRQE